MPSAARLLARKLIEKGSVRPAQRGPGTATTSSSGPRQPRPRRRPADRGPAIADLLASGAPGEHAGRVVRGVRQVTPDNGVRQGTAYGRDHNPRVMTIPAPAGGGCRAGYDRGTDERMMAVEEVRHVRDFHVTLLRLLLDEDNRLHFYYHGGGLQLSRSSAESIGAADRVSGR